jgi:hypothetical protein
VIEVEEDGLRSAYVVEREIDSNPRVLRNGVRDTLSDDLLRELEIYSQSALQEIASEDRLDLRLELIDRPHRVEVDRIREQIRTHIGTLQSVGPDVRTVRSEIEKRRSEVKPLDSLRAELTATVAVRPELPPTLQEQHDSYLKRQRVLALTDDLVIVQGETDRTLKSIPNLLQRVISTEIGLHEAGINLDDLYSLIAKFKTSLSEICSSGADLARLPFEQARTNLNDGFEHANELYYTQRQQQQALNESLKREDQVSRRIAELEKIEKELRAFETRKEDLLKSRKNARIQLNTLAEQLFELRVQEVDRINKEFGDVVFLTVRRGTQSQDYITRLSSLLAGSRVRTQENIAEEIAAVFSPADLLDVIENGDAQRLASLLDRDLNQVTRVLTYLRDHPDLYALEDKPFDDILEITMYDHGQPKSVESLSDGQKATALLPLILRGASCPLIIDQPEDDLDNSFVFQVLVKNILKLKQTRQLVFVTHNANIPVLGNAETVVVMHMERPSKAAPPLSGTVEDCKLHILDLLEGGKEAFQERERRYSATAQ